MCDREHFDTLRDRVERLEDDVKVYHARTWRDMSPSARAARGESYERSWNLQCGRLETAGTEKQGKAVRNAQRIQAQRQAGSREAPARNLGGRVVSRHADLAAHGTTAMPGDNMFASYHRIGDSVHVGGVDGFDARVVEVRFSIGCSPRYVLHRVDPGEHDVMETILSREEISIHDPDGGGAE